VTEAYNAVICLTRMVNAGTCFDCRGIKKLMYLDIPYLCVPYDPQTKYRLFRKTTLTDWYK